MRIKFNKFCRGRIKNFFTGNCFIPEEVIYDDIRRKLS
ncbi:hypothetical protein BN133_888 [Cronobacter dublinensis 582]|nr:hypothetical protein BN133_888 [Cronobacter dublinensis 582]